ncbi:MAG: hypothetical protein JNM56_21770 [Planctomycetia bacterium]|nr:hypothetical protein [Planctomycetia bacterium]
MPPQEAAPSATGVSRPLAYIADLELEVDRLRKHCQFIQQAVREELQQLHRICGTATTGTSADTPLAEVQGAVQRLTGVMRDLHEPGGYHPAHDQVVAMAIRPLVEQVFRWQQRLEDAAQATLELDLASEHVEWFPARLRHLLNNLLSNALKYRDPAKSCCWVRVSLRVTDTGYDLRVTDNGRGLRATDAGAASLFYRRAPVDAPGPGVGLAVVTLLVEQSGGAITTDSADGQGTTICVTLPRYDLADFLT